MLLHTLIDWMRMVEGDGDGEAREVNHHGKSITVGRGKGVDTELSGVCCLIVQESPHAQMVQGRIVMQEGRSLQAGMLLMK